MEKVVVKTNKKNACLVDVSMSITYGKLLAILYGLEARVAIGSPVAQDVMDMLLMAANKDGVRIDGFPHKS